ncbi:MAG: hypothetical protein ACXVA9_12470 [Bdellovibrionales bacterium]
MESLYSQYWNRNQPMDSFERIKEGSPDVGFDSELRKEMESLLEDAKKRISAQDSQENIADAG